MRQATKPIPTEAMGALQSAALATGVSVESSVKAVEGIIQLKSKFDAASIEFTEAEKNIILNQVFRIYADIGKMPPYNSELMEQIYKNLNNGKPPVVRILGVEPPPPINYPFYERKGIQISLAAAWVLC